MQNSKSQLKIQKFLDDNPTFYITRDGERALFGDYKNFFIVANDSPLLEDRKNILKVSGQKGELYLSTRELLASSKILDAIKKISGEAQPKIVVFKNTLQMERICEEYGWDLLSSRSEIADRIEKKVSQYAWFREKKSLNIESLIPDSAVGEVGQFKFTDVENQFGLPFILQYNTGHTGSGTKLISSIEDWEDEARRFPYREVKLSEYIEGKMYTINACVSKDNIQCGYTSEQITGLPELTRLPFSTVGNDWSSVPEDIHEKVKNIALEVGKYMREDGWVGLFGVDVLIPHKGSDASQDAYIIEINARQPASAVCESYLEQKQKKTPTIMEHHVASLLDLDLGNLTADDNPISGSQIFVRKLSRGAAALDFDLEVGEYSYKDGKLEFVKSAQSLLGISEENYFIFPQASGKLYRQNDEMFRVQSVRGVLDEDGKLKEDVLDVIEELRGKIRG